MFPRSVSFGLLACVLLTGSTAQAAALSLRHIINDPTPTQSDQFGRRVALHGDRLLIGAPTDDTAGTNVGQAHLFDARDGSLIRTFNDPSPAGTNHFGWSVAINSHYILLGAPKHNNDVGEVHVFDSDTGALIRTLTDIAPASGDQFGFSVALDGDLALVGLRFDASIIRQGGQAQLFDLSTGQHLATINDPTSSTTGCCGVGDQMGFSVALGSGYAAVAATRANDFRGEVHVYDVSDAANGVTRLYTLNPPPPVSRLDHFGIDIGISGGKLLVGEREDDAQAVDAGVAYLYDLATGTLETTFYNPTPTDGDVFGQAVALHGAAALIGAFRAESAGIEVGQAYLFDPASGALLQSFDHPTPTTGHDFAIHVALGSDRVLVGARNDDTAGTGVGQAYLFGPALVADAGNDQSVPEGDTVQLDGSDSIGATSLTWTQVAGPSVQLQPSTSHVAPTFLAPYVSGDTTLTFALTVANADGTSDTDSVNVSLVQINDTPVADAGDDGTIKAGAVATLDGRHSFDPDGDGMHFHWTQTGGPSVVLVPDAAVINPSFTAPTGIGTELIFDLVVSDGKETSTPDTVVFTVVGNSPPTADAGPDQTVEEGSVVMLDASASGDPDGGDVLSFEWTGPVSLSDPGSPTPVFTAPPAPPGGDSLTFAVDVSDDDPVDPKSDRDDVIVTVQNVNDPPACELARSQCPKSPSNEVCELWPPNHKLLEVAIAGVSDPDDDDVSVRITGVTQDESVNGGGDGDTSPDAVIGEESLLLRAERSGTGNGRVYQVSFIADDGFETCSGSIGVFVRHSRRSDAVDDGQAFDSTAP